MLGVVFEPTLMLGGLAAAAMAALSYARPRVGIVLWLAVVSFVPFWTRISLAGLSLQPATLIGLPVLIGIIFSRRSPKPKLHAVDTVLLLALVVVTVYTFAGHLPTFPLVGLVTVAAVAYTLGRVADPRIQKSFAIIMVGVAIFGLFEFALDWHPFTGWFLSVNHHWDLIQERGSLKRSEASMGHAIAFGACLALALPFTKKLGRAGTWTQWLLIGGIVVSLSRGPLVAMVVTLGLGAVALATGRKRFWSVLAAAAGVVIVYLLFDLLYSGEAADEVASSGDARANQLDVAFGLLNPVGPASGLTLDDGALNVPGLMVIDSTPLRFALNFGWIIAIMLLMPVLYAIFAFIRGKAGPSTIALLGQLPIVLVTSLITQWQAIFFFVAGMAVTELQRRRRKETPEDLRRKAQNVFARPPAPASRY
ncbi:hypothetical protein Achl_2934 [Pseudarthrobacter chlorophenolicus A6]|uniref:O-antigen polymerase n=1 Tax=Pseudarthrobacter chlorophenolicus (strain ATCC 700700 / DSM 12829 / CIP 107037 / JCM 12360 / KCTC 9906 / NCIMB 13794 / A6) TaxID=452863 RepID=B8HEF1_PSECP|nr:hypothetical protein Achl_2934 [Pseudarthrobacter chlorophenolicus A6]SDQ73254.1 hypothetical protein SAMN04489738_2545 [Pseudarthrobacter chlorophenolicus]